MTDLKNIKPEFESGRSIGLCLQSKSDRATPAELSHMIEEIRKVLGPEKRQLAMNGTHGEGLRSLPESLEHLTLPLPSGPVVVMGIGIGR